MVDINKGVTQWCNLTQWAGQKWIFQPRGGSRPAATYKMERFVIIANGWRPLTIITKRSILDVAAALDPSLQPFHLTHLLIIYETKYLRIDQVKFVEHSL